MIPGIVLFDPRADALGGEVGGMMPGCFAIALYKIAQSYDGLGEGLEV